MRKWSSFVDPECGVPSFISHYTGISAEMLEGAPKFRELAPELRKTLEGAVLVAHNARFDYGFLRNEFRRLDQGLSMPVLCTVKLARALYPGHRSYSLDALIARHRLSCAARHRALGDAEAMLDFFLAARAEHGREALQAASEVQLKRPSLPPALDPLSVGDLPDGPGVYLFYDEAGRLLYVGKSVNLRNRILSHFSGDHAVHKDMRISAQLAEVRCVETAGELGALIRESCLIKEHTPVHNRRLRRQNGLFTWCLDTDSDFHRPVLLGEKDLEGDDPRGNFGLFRNRRSAKMALRKLCANDGLCPVRCGLEKSDGPCFAFQLGRCRGACAGRESSVVHNLRLAAALAALRVSAWPFAGAIGIRERDETRGREEIHLFENWRWLGSAENEETLAELLELRKQQGFDLDIYRILKAWLKRQAGRCDIIEFKESAQPSMSSA